jgi:hypothetical protein
MVMAPAMEGPTMRTTLIAASIIVALASAPAEATRNSDPMPDAPKDECVFVRNISSWRVLDHRNVVLFTGNANRAYLAQLAMPASDLTYTFKVAFIDHDRDGQLCGRSLDKVQAVGSPVSQPATIMSMTRLDETGLQQLEARYDVKLPRKKERESRQPPHPR